MNCTPKVRHNIWGAVHKWANLFYSHPLLITSHGLARLGEVDKETQSKLFFLMTMWFRTKIPNRRLSKDYKKIEAN